MPDANNPVQGTGEAAPVAEKSAMDALADILDEPETDNAGSEAAKPAGTEAKPKSAVDDVLGDGEADDPESATDDETSTDEGSEGPRDAAGRFISPNARVRMPDGTTATVAELTQGHLRQSDYTRKTQELSEHRKEFEAQQARANETFQHLQTRYQQVDSWLEATKPQRPNVPYAQDPVAWGEYNQAKEGWDEAQRYWAAQRQETARAYQEQRDTKVREYLKKETDALYRAIPAFREQSKRDAFVSAAMDAYSELGFQRAEIAGLTDHRMILVLRDAVKWRRAQAKKETVTKELEQKPQLIRGSKRTTPATKADTQKRLATERLLETGSFQDGVRAIGHLLD